MQKITIAKIGLFVVYFKPKRKGRKMADKVIVVKERRSGCGCGGLALLALVAVVGFVVYTWSEAENRKMAARDAFDRSQRGAAPSGAALNADATPSTPSSAWKVGRSRDDMTDAVTYILALDGLRIEDGIVNYTPRLALQLPQSARTSGDFSAAECIVRIEPEAIHRSGVTAEVRFDQNPVEKIALEAGQDRSSVFFPAGFVKRLDGARTLIVRFDTSLGKVRTLRFNLGGVTLDALAKKLKRETVAE